MYKTSHESKNSISDSRFHYNILSENMHNHTLFKNSIANHQFLTMYSLTFNPIRAIRAPLPSNGTRSHVPFCYFVKRFKPKSMLISLWLINTTYSRFVIQANLIQMAFRISAKNLPRLIQNKFHPLLKLRLVTSLFCHFLAKRPHIFKRDGIWTTSIGYYFEPVIIQLDLPPANFQLTVTSSSQTTSSSFFFSRKYFLPAIYQMTMK